MRAPTALLAALACLLMTPAAVDAAGPGKMKRPRSGAGATAPRIGISPNAKQLKAKLPLTAKVDAATAEKLIREVTPLGRGQTVTLIPSDPTAKGIQLYVQGGTFQPANSLGRSAGLYFDGHDSGSLPTSSAGVAFFPQLMQGDDLIVDCRGQLAGNMDVLLMHATGTGLGFPTFERVKLNGASGKLKFIVSTAGKDEGFMIVDLSTRTKGEWRLDRCTVRREAA